MRKSFQGVMNVVRFNRHFYLLSFGLIILFVISGFILSISIYQWLALLIALPVVISLTVSLYVYDLSGFYHLNWLNVTPNQNIININAGFDEISGILHQKFSESALTVLDFYDPLLHTEISIKRARKAYPPYRGTVAIKTLFIPLSDNLADKILLVFAAHEIRNAVERARFFKELNRILKADGEIVLIEHLRDVSNLFAYNIGFLHFASRKVWYETFRSVGFLITESKINPFVTMFILKKNGD